MNALEMSIQMEIEGKEYYYTAAMNAGDSLGKALFERLAQEEDIHAAKAREIYDSLDRGENPLVLEVSLDRGQKIGSIFAEAIKEITPKREIASGEMEAIENALKMEGKSRKFYEEQTGSAATRFEEHFFKALVSEEQGHYLSLLSYREYLIDPVGWFTKSEHHSMDGG